MVHDAPDSPESQLIGGPIQEHPDLVARANPITYVRPGVPPFLIVHGDRDPLVPFNQSELLEAALRRVGGDVRLVRLEGAGHGGPPSRRRRSGNSSTTSSTGTWAAPSFSPSDRRSASPPRP